MDPDLAPSAPPRRPSRVAGSDAERRAAVELRARLEAGGRAAEIEPFRFHQRWALAQAIAAGAAVVGSVLSVSSAGVGTAVVAVAALLSIVESAGVAGPLSRMTGTRASQNVSSPPAGGERRGLLVLAAGCDTPRDSAFGRLAERGRAPWLALAAALLAVLACCAARVAGGEGDALTAVQLVPTLLLLAAVPLLVDVELSPVGDGAPVAAGVEVAIALAEQLGDELEQLDVWLVLAGAQGARGSGMRAWRRRHRTALSARPTATIEVGAPAPETAEAVHDHYAEVARELDAALSEPRR